MRFPLFEQLNGSNRKSFDVDIKQETVDNTDYRRVLFTTADTQLVLMSLEPEQEIGEEVHDGAQFIRFEAGTGKVVMGSREVDVKDGSAVVIPRGITHNVINTGSDDLKLYALYSPPEHEDGTVHKTKDEE